MQDIGMKSPPPPWHPQAAMIRAYAMRQGQIDLELRRKVNAMIERVPHWLFAQCMGGSGFQMASLLRWYVREYADRMMKQGIHALPSSFNVVEAFLHYDETVLLFGLRREREHLLHPDDYFDWYSDTSLAKSPPLLIDTMKDGLVYSYDFAAGNAGYKIKGSASAFALAGASFVRHEHELSCILLAGEHPPLNTDAEIDSIDRTKDQLAKGKETIKSAPSLTILDRYLDGYPEFARVIVLARFDLRTAKHDVRYFMLDVGKSYRVLTDDTAILSDLPIDDRTKYLSEMPFDRYEVLFSTLASLMYLPIAMLSMPDRIKDLAFPTVFGTEPSNPNVKQAVKSLWTSEICRERTVWCLKSLRTDNTPDSRTVIPPDLQFETAGYWKPLSPGEIGQDKSGKPVVGRSWVTRHETWHANSPSIFTLSRSTGIAKGKDPGIVYIVRSPGHAVDLYKIGLTRRTADVRAGELSSTTGVPMPFGVLANWNVGDCAAVEAEVHRRLGPMRVNPNREFFCGKLQAIVAVVNEVVERLQNP